MATRKRPWRPDKKPYRGNPKRDVHDARREAHAREKAETLAAFEAVCASRPLKPPPTRVEAAPRRSAGALALAADRRAGLVGVPEFSLDAIEEQEP